VELVRETWAPLAASGAEIPFWVHPIWLASMPWLLQGTTGRGPAEPFDLGLAGTQPVARALGNWWRLRDAVQCSSVAFARQVHASDVLTHHEVAPGLLLTPAADGHATSTAGLLLAVSVADCVPISLVCSRTRAIVLLHAGWRGIAAGILERGLRVLGELLAGRTSDVRIHFGPAICGQCYEVGPEVHAALGLPRNGPAGTVDLRAALADRAVAAGVEPAAISSSSWCTRCDSSVFFSHRAGDAGRQVGVLGLRSPAAQ
jgi:polyphenol oxidase